MQCSSSSVLSIIASVPTNTSKSKEFFSSPEEQKADYAIHSDKAGGINRGWVKMAGESLDPEGQKVILQPTTLTSLPD